MRCSTGSISRIASPTPINESASWSILFPSDVDELPEDDAELDAAMDDSCSFTNISSCAVVSRICCRRRTVLAFISSRAAPLEASLLPGPEPAPPAGSITARLLLNPCALLCSLELPAGGGAGPTILEIRVNGSPATLNECTACGTPAFPPFPPFDRVGGVPRGRRA